MKLFHSSVRLPVISISRTGWVIFPFLKAKPSMPKEKSPVTGLLLPPLNPVTSIPFLQYCSISFKDTEISPSANSFPFIYGIRQGLDASSTVGSNDELVLEVAPGERDAVEKLVREEMGAAADLSVPLDVSVGIGVSWHEAGH